MVPLATPATVQPLWVQTALKALNSPALGWVTTIFVASKTLPPPTGMSATLITSLPEPAEPVPAPTVPPAVLAGYSAHARAWGVLGVWWSCIFIVVGWGRRRAVAGCWLVAVVGRGWRGGSGAWRGLGGGGAG